jgi:hypothetical protein
MQHLCALVPGQRVTRMRVLALLALGIAQALAVTPQRVAAALAGPDRASSLERRFWRWLANPGVDPVALWGGLVPLLATRHAGPQPLLVFDPTPVGRRFTLLMVSLVIGNRAAPLAWRVVPQQTTWPERMAPLLAAVLAQARTALPAEIPATVLLDRGLSGPGIVDAVQAAGFDVVLRLRCGPHDALRVRLEDGSEQAIGALVTGKGQRWSGSVQIFKQAGWRAGWLTVWWSRDHAEPLVLFSTRPGGAERVREYRRRMAVEATYADLKRRGLRLEANRMRAAERLDRLLVAVSLAVWWLMELGWRAIKDGTRRLVDRTDRRDWSVLRLGWWWLQHRLEQRRALPLPGAGCCRFPAPLPPGAQSVR